MKRLVLFLITLCLVVPALIIFCRTEQQTDARWLMWYDKPAEQFIEALVLGNGRMGATVYGGIDNERISLNEMTLWSGEPVDVDADRLAAAEGLAPVRKALEEEDYRKADELQKRLQGSFSECYAPLGSLCIEFANGSTAENYRRELDIEKALSRVAYTIDGVDFSRIYFLSAPDKVLVIKLSASEKGALNCDLTFDSKLRYEATSSEKQIVVDGYVPYNITYHRDISWDENRGTHFATIIKATDTDGCVVAENGKLSLRNASHATILVTAATSFNGFNKDPVKQGRDYMALANEQMGAAEKFAYKRLRKRHIADYGQYFDRVDVQLGAPTEVADMPTDKRLLALSEGAEDNNLEMLYFQFGRYLMISASRTPEVPMHLQGIWNESLTPPWNSNYTVNINTEENYWPTEVLNLSELHEPLLSFIGNIAQTGRHTAKNYYDCGGWVTCHNSDIWAMSNPVGEFWGDPSWANWPMGGAWLSTHLWEHYLFTLDKEYLAEWAYPLLKGAAEFCMDWLIKDKNGYLITSPATSPENFFFTPDGYAGQTAYGTTCDLAIIRECLAATAGAAAELGTDEEFRERIAKCLERIYPYQVGHKGNLQEWYYDWEDPYPTHRHQSHLIGLFPGSHITPERTPQLAAACARSLELRGDKSTGWSTGWRINLWARLLDGERAYRIYRTLLTYVDNDQRRGGGTYPNLLDAHPPFQIDGNFGGISGVAEMLLQSHLGSVDLLPALPAAWSEGSFRGVCARGGFELSAQWSAAAITEGELLSKGGRRCTLRTPNKVIVNANDVEYSCENGLFVASFPTRQGKRYKFVSQ